MAIFHEHYKNLNELITTLDGRKTNSAFKGESHHSQEKGRVDFTGVASYADAIEIMQEGYKEPLKDMQRATLKINESETHERPKMRASVAGFAPIVPNAIIGHPMSMYRRDKKQKGKGKAIRIVYSFGVSSLVRKEDIIKAGVHLISLVNSLEKQGYRVMIDALFASFSGEDSAIMSVTLKEYGQKLNLLKLTFPLVHPAMLRRICFKFVETVPGLTNKNYNDTYGIPLSGKHRGREAQAKYLRDTKIIKGDYSYYIDAHTAYSVANIQDLAQAIGLQ